MSNFLWKSDFHVENLHHTMTLTAAWSQLVVVANYSVLVSHCPAYSVQYICTHIVMFCGEIYGVEDVAMCIVM